jgi:hypothetical protein
MPQKKKKAKIQKSLKPKAKNPKKGAGSALQKAVKVVAKKVGGALAKKAKAKSPVPPPAKATAKKAGNPAKKGGVKLPAKAKDSKKQLKAKGSSSSGAASGALPAKLKQKDQKKAGAEQVKVKGGKKKEVVLEVPSPKGVALLGREGKKKTKLSESSSAGGKKRCREPGCEHEVLLSGYCRLHYIKNWRKIKRKEAILASGQLNNYVEELVNKYPDKYLDVIRQDLVSEKEWAKVVVDLELESSEEEGAGDEDLDGVAEGTRREREFDDDSDSF